MKLIKKIKPTIKKRKRKAPKEPRKRVRVVYPPQDTPHEWLNVVVKSRQLGWSRIYYGFDMINGNQCRYCGAFRKTIHKGAVEVIEHCPKAKAAIMDQVLE